MLSEKFIKLYDIGITQKNTSIQLVSSKNIFYEGALFIYKQALNQTVWQILSNSAPSTSVSLPTNVVDAESTTIKHKFRTSMDKMISPKKFFFSFIAYCSVQL